MTKTVELLFDFASPNVYFAYRVLPELLARTGAELIVTPCLLGGLFKLTNNRAPFEAFGPVKGKMAYELLEIQRFVASHKLTKFRMNPHFPVTSRILMRGLVAAQMNGDAAAYTAYIEAGLQGMWEDGLKMSEGDVFVERMNAAGLDGAALLAADQTPEVKQKLLDLTQAAADRGAFGLPTLFVGKEMFFGKERLGQVAEQLAA
jgi:2-hydroxychromene-2-carboxylate isomerase